MELHQLRYVLKLAAHLHFSNAANDLGITQPSLSQQLDKLEKELGVKLFERRTRSVELTMAGEEFVMQANNVLTELGRLGELMQKYALAKKESIRIGTFVSNMGQFKSSRLFQRFQDTCPETNIHITEKAGSIDLLKLLRAGSIDATFLVPSPEIRSDSTLTCHSLIPGIINVIVKRDHPFAGGRTVLLQEIAEEHCVVMSRTYSVYGVVIAACKASGFNLKIVSHCNNIDTMVDLVAQGFGISFLSSQFAETIAHPDIVVRPLEPIIERNLSFVYLSNKGLSPTLVRFRDFVLKTFSSGKHPFAG